MKKNFETFEINGKKYTAKEIGFATVLKFEDFGVDISSMQEKPMNAIVAYFAVCSGLTKDKATEEFEKHLVNGGDMESIYNAFSGKIEDSGFFQALQKKAAENPQ